MPKHRANRDRYRINTYVNDAYHNRYYITEYSDSPINASKKAYATRKEEKDIYNSQGVRANIYSNIRKVPNKTYKRKR